MEAHTPISEGQHRACPRHFTNFLHRAAFFFFLFQRHKSAVSCCVTQDMQDTLLRVTNPMETLSINFNKEFIRTRRNVGGGCQSEGRGGRKRNKMGLRNTAKAFNHRRAVRPGFSPTGAKRQMGSITALAGHTHTTSIAISIKGTPQRGNRTGGEMKKTEKWARRRGKKKEKKKISQ